MEETMNDDIMNKSTANQQQSQSNWGNWLTQLGGVAAQVGYNIYANKQNQKFNAQQAELQRQYETQMANTAYQRQQADLKAAGLNPHLAGGQGGADTTAGAAATSSGMQAADIGGLGAFGLQTAITKAQKENLEADTRLKGKEAGKTEAETKMTEALTKVQPALIKAQTALANANTDKAKNEAIKEAADAAIAGLQAEMANMDVRKRKFGYDHEINNYKKQLYLEMLNQGWEDTDAKRVINAIGETMNAISPFTIFTGKSSKQ